MEENDVGTVVVLKGDRAAGILTDRDLVVRAIAQNMDPDLTRVSEIMTTPVRSVYESTPIEDALSEMAAAGARRLIVTGANDRIIGMLALDDVLDLLTEEAEAIGRLLGKQRPRTPVKTPI
jgi:signal-transduction protein with cAMP-binding, CBS, and nucleotidyltransferase domain